MEKVHAPCTVTTGTWSDKGEFSSVLDQHVSYEQWRQFDPDFTVFTNVKLLVGLAEETYTEIQSVLQKNIPYGATVASVYKKRVMKQQTPTVLRVSQPGAPSSAPVQAQPQIQVPVSSPQCICSGAPYQNEIMGVAQTLVVIQGIPYPLAVQRAKKQIYEAKGLNDDGTPKVVAVQPPPVLAPEQSPANAPTAAPSPGVVPGSSPQDDYYEYVDMADVEVTKTIGPFMRDAQFDVMIFNMLTKEGILHRNKSDKHYTVSFDVTKPPYHPKLLRETTREELKPGMRDMWSTTKM